MADVAFFIQQLKQQPEYEHSPVIVIGGSYSANMAAWMRAKYPHLVQVFSCNINLNFSYIIRYQKLNLQQFKID